MSGLRNGLRRVATDRGDWAGIPMPLEGERLVVEPGYPNAALFAAMGGPTDEDRLPEDPVLVGAKVRNTFRSAKKRSHVHVFELASGRIEWGITPDIHGADKLLRTLGCSDAWGIEQEQAALQLLGTMVRHRQFKQYLLTGSFIETSARSGVTYLFRRLRPTVAMSVSKGRMRILCALCLHPIAYYAGSWAGAMCPTDDVVAHLALMRGDEPMLWRRSNQHPAWDSAAGLS